MLMDMERTNKISNLINKPVLSRSGVFMGRVCDVIFNPEDMRIKGYMVKTGKVLRFTRFLSSGSVEKTDKSGIIVEGRDAFEPVSNIKRCACRKLYAKCKRHPYTEGAGRRGQDK